MPARRRARSMSSPLPPAQFWWPVRVYYEDTDAGGIVYNANYLKFMERARTEWLREMGIAHGELSAKTGLQLIITRADIQFRAPARLDDALQVGVKMANLRRASLVLQQEVRDDASRLLSEAQVTVACVDKVNLRPRPLPHALRGVLE
jgi:acyl-CoA thioester hydrolase